MAEWASNSGSGGLGFKPRPSHVSILLGLPCSRQSSHPGGVIILPGMIHAKETWMSSGHLDFGLCAPLLYFYCNPKYGQLNMPLILTHQSLISLDY